MHSRPKDVEQEYGCNADGETASIRLQKNGLPPSKTKMHGHQPKGASS